MKNHQPTHHVSPRIHHQLTTKTPRFCTSFSPTPLKKPSKNNETPALTGAPFFLKRLNLRRLFRLCSRSLLSIRSRCFFSGYRGLRDGFRLLPQRMNHHPQHLFFWSRFPRKYLKLSRPLLHKHLNSSDDWNTILPRHTQKRRLQRVIHQVEDQ